MHEKLILESVLILVNNPKLYCMQDSILKINILKGDYQKAFTKLTLFFLLNPVPFNEDYENQKDQSSDQWLSRLQSKFRKIPLIIMVNYLIKFDEI